MTTTRRLAAILAADVVGYSRLMEADEAGTLAALKARRKGILAPLVAQHEGRIVKVMGDGVLVEFASAVNAVKCAVELQQRMDEANSEVPEDRRIVLRIGVNLGDIIVEGTDLYGDGVNIAARLQALAEPGCICISGKVRDEVMRKLDVGLEDLGLREIKNIAAPVRVYRVTTERAAAEPAALSLPDKPSIAVLPFENMSGEPDQEYFSDGITEDIITSLSKVSLLFVIARNSAFTYKRKAVKVQQVGAELGVRYVVEGSVRKVGGRVRITAQLIDARTGGHLWAERFDRELTDIFAVQDEVTQEIVSALALKLTAEEQRRLVRKGTEDVEAYDCFLRGREAWWRHTREANPEAQAMFTRAIEIDPRFSTAFAFLAFTHSQDYINGWTASPERSLQLCYECARHAVALDGTDPAARVALSSAHLWRREHDAAIAEAKASVVLDPNYSLGHSLLGWAVHYAGRHEEAIECYNKAMRVDPHYPGVYLHFLAQAYFMLGRLDDAVAALRRRLLRDPWSDISRVLLAACYGHLGRADDGRAEWTEALRINPEYSLEHRRRVLPFKDPGSFERIVEGLRKAGIPG